MFVHPGRVCAKDVRARTRAASVCQLLVMQQALWIFFLEQGYGCVVVGEELLAATYGRPGEVRQGGGVDGLNAAVCRGDTIRQNDLNTFIKALSAKASVKFGPTGVNSFREMGAKNKRHYVVTDPG